VAAPVNRHPDAVRQRGEHDDDLGVLVPEAVVADDGGLDPVLRQLAEELQRDVRDDLDVDPRVVVDLHPPRRVHVRDVPEGLQVDVRELMILVTSAKIKISPDYLWDDVVAGVRAAILDQFGFAKRSLGQPALLCELIAAIQKVEGVVYVDVDAFGGIPEREPDGKGNRILVDMASISKKVHQITDPESGRQNQPVEVNPRVDVNQADLEKGVIRPAQLGIFTDAVPDTIVLNQIL